MCVAIPARVVRRTGESRALVAQGELVREVSVLLVPGVQEGDYVLLNLGVAVQKLSEEEALEVLDLWRQIALSMLEKEEIEAGHE